MRQGTKFNKLRLLSRLIIFKKMEINSIVEYNEAEVDRLEYLKQDLAATEKEFLEVATDFFLKKSDKIELNFARIGLDNFHKKSGNNN